MISLISRAGLSYLMALEGVSARRVEIIRRFHVLAIDRGKERELVHRADHAPVGCLGDRDFAYPRNLGGNERLIPSVHGQRGGQFSWKPFDHSRGGRER